MNKSDIRSLICTTFSDLKNNINRGAKVVNCLDAKNHMCPFSEHGGMLRACEKEIAVAEKDLLERLEAAYDKCSQLECDGLKRLERKVDGWIRCPIQSGACIQVDSTSTPVTKYQELHNGNYTIHAGVILQQKDYEEISIRHAYVEVYGSLFHATLHKEAVVEVWRGGRAYNISLCNSTTELRYSGGCGSSIACTFGSVEAKGKDTFLEAVNINEGKLSLSDGAKAIRVSLVDGGSAYVTRAVLAGTTVKSGGVLIGNSATLENVAVHRSGSVSMHSCTVDGLEMQGGSMCLNDATKITSCYVSSGAMVNCMGKDNTLTHVGIRDANIHMDHGAVDEFTVYSGGDLFMSKGSVTSGQVTSRGHVRVLGSSLVKEVIVDGGKMEIMGGATGSLMFHKEGPTASKVIVESLGQFVVGHSATLSSARVTKGGSLWVWSRGNVSDLIIGSNGTVIVSSGGLVENCRVDSGGELIVLDGGHAKMDLNGGTVRGNMHGAVCQMTYEPGDDKNG